MNVVLRRYARPPISTWEPSSKQGEPEMMEGMWDENGRSWPGQALESEQPQRCKANQSFPLVEGGQWAKCCCSVVEEELKGVAEGFGDLWRAAADGAGSTGPIPSICDLLPQKPLPSLGEGLREAPAAWLILRSLPSTLCLPGALGGHAQGGWPTASCSSCRPTAETARGPALIAALSSLPQSPGHGTQQGP